MGRDDERGAVALLVAVVMVVLIGVGALTVDIGAQRVARADMQALADVVALDLARELDGRTAAEIGSLQARADEVRDRNDATIGETPTVTPSLWVVNPAAGDLTAAAPDDVPNAVRVEARTSVGFAFGIADSGAAARQATAYASPNACLKLGSSALEVASGDDELLDLVLGDVLGGSVDLSAADHQGLATATVTLADLAAELSAGTVDELLATRVSLADFYVVVADSLDGADEGAAATIIRTSLLALASGAAGLDPVTVGDLLAIGPAGAAALAASVDALSLVTAAAYVANGDHAIALGADGPVTATLHVVEPPRIACGGGTARTAQLDLELAGHQSGVGVDVDLTTTLQVATASGTVGTVSCTDGAATGLSVLLDRPTLASMSTKLEGTVLGAIHTSIVVPGTVPAQGSGGTYALSLPANYDVPVTSAAGSGSLGVDDLTRAGASALGLDLTVLEAATLLPVLNPILQGWTDTVAAEAAALGLRLANADMYGVRTAQCLNPSLIG
jgi:uncharacterized membrane protein